MAGRVQALVSQELRQPNQVVAIVFKVAVRHRVPEQVRVQVNADDSRILVDRVLKWDLPHSR